MLYAWEFKTSWNETSYLWRLQSYKDISLLEHSVNNTWKNLSEQQEKDYSRGEKTFPARLVSSLAGNKFTVVKSGTYVKMSDYP